MNAIYNFLMTISWESVFNFIKNNIFFIFLGITVITILYRIAEFYVKIAIALGVFLVCICVFFM